MYRNQTTAVRRSVPRHTPGGAVPVVGSRSSTRRGSSAAAHQLGTPPRDLAQVGQHWSRTPSPPESRCRFAPYRPPDPAGAADATTAPPSAGGRSTSAGPCAGLGLSTNVSPRTGASAGWRPACRPPCGTLGGDLGAHGSSASRVSRTRAGRGGRPARVATVGRTKPADQDVYARDSAETRCAAVSDPPLGPWALVAPVRRTFRHYWQVPPSPWWSTPVLISSIRRVTMSSSGGSPQIAHRFPPKITAKPKMMAPIMNNHSSIGLRRILSAMCSRSYVDRFLVGLGECSATLMALPRIVRSLQCSEATAFPSWTFPARLLVHRQEKPLPLAQPGDSTAPTHPDGERLTGPLSSTPTGLGAPPGTHAGACVHEP